VQGVYKHPSITNNNISVTIERRHGVVAAFRDQVGQVLLYFSTLKKGLYHRVAFEPLNQFMGIEVGLDEVGQHPSDTHRQGILVCIDESRAGKPCRGLADKLDAGAVSRREIEAVRDLLLGELNHFFNS